MQNARAARCLAWSLPGLSWALLLTAQPAHADAALPEPTPAAREAEGWHEALLDRVAADLRAGRPLVAEVHVALCSNNVLTCGGHGLGAGGDLTRNLYWATSGGFRGWFDRKGSGWARAARTAGNAAAELEVAVWHRRVTPGAVWRRRGVRAPFDVYVVASAWNGDAPDDAIGAYLADLYGVAPRVVRLDDGSFIDAGGAAQLVSYVGHDRFMDYDNGVDWSAIESRAPRGAPTKGTVVMACKTAQWLGGTIPSPARVPLLMTRDFVFAGAHAFDGALDAFTRGAGLAAIRESAAHAYATGQGTSFDRVQSVFTNPSHRRWLPGRASARPEH